MNAIYNLHNDIKSIEEYFPQDSKCHLVAPAVVDLDPSMAMQDQPGVHSYYMVGKVRQQINHKQCKHHHQHHNNPSLANHSPLLPKPILML